MPALPKVFFKPDFEPEAKLLARGEGPTFWGGALFSWSCLTFARLSPLCRGAIYAVLRVVPPRGVLVSCIVFFLLKVDAPPETDLLGSFDPLTDRWQPDPARA